MYQGVYKKNIIQISYSKQLDKNKLELLKC